MAEESKNQSLPRGLIGRRGAPTGKAARLPSLRGPRDLTLGGVPKKVFTPNIPSRRDKPKEESWSASAQPKPQTSSKSSKGRGGRERGRGRGRGHENVIQSHSIFEQGPAERLMPKGGGSSWDDRDRVSTSRVSAKKEKSSKENTKRVLDDILRDDFIDDGEADDQDLFPVVLPLSSAGAASVKKEGKKEVKDATDKVKAEPGAEMEVDGSDEKSQDKPSSSSAPDVAVVKTEAPVFTCKDLLSKCKSEEGDRLVFLQLPDVLPGLPPGRDEVVKTKIKTEPGTEPKKKEESPEDKLSSKLNTCSLSDFSEGFIGKLQVRRSGKAELVMGNVTLDVSVGTPCGFLQDLVSVRVEGNTGHITTLGHIRDRLICTPDFETLLNNT